MGPPSYMRSIIDRNVVMQHMTVISMTANPKNNNLAFINVFVSFK